MIRRQLGAELRRLREQSHRTSADVARELGWSDSKLSRIETARIGVSADDLDRLCALYGVDRPAAERLRELNRQSRQRVWWEGYRDVLLDQYEAYIAYENEASAIRAFFPTIVPGLLQTDEYARAVVEADSSSDDPSVIGARVMVRMARQAILSRNPPPLVHVVLDEAVIRRQIGGPDVTRRQLSHLLSQVQRESITIQVLPFSVGAHRGLGGAFVLLDLPADAGDSLVYCDGMTGGLIRSRPAEIEVYEAAFRAVSSVALGPEDSAHLIAAAVDTTPDDDR